MARPYAAAPVDEPSPTKLRAPPRDAFAELERPTTATIDALGRDRATQVTVAVHVLERPRGPVVASVSVSVPVTATFGTLARKAQHARAASTLRRTARKTRESRRTFAAPLGGGAQSKLPSGVFLEPTCDVDGRCVLRSSGLPGCRCAGGVALTPILSNRAVPLPDEPLFVLDGATIVLPPPPSEAPAMDSGTLVVAEPVFTLDATAPEAWMLVPERIATTAGGDPVQSDWQVAAYACGARKQKAVAAVLATRAAVQARHAALAEELYQEGIDLRSAKLRAIFGELLYDKTFVDKDEQKRDMDVWQAVWRIVHDDDQERVRSMLATFFSQLDEVFKIYASSKCPGDDHTVDQQEFRLFASDCGYSKDKKVAKLVVDPVFLESQIERNAEEEAKGGPTMLSTLGRAEFLYSLVSSAASRAVRRRCRCRLSSPRPSRIARRVCAAGVASPCSP